MKSYGPLLAGGILSGLMGYLALLVISSTDDTQLFIEFTIAWGLYSSVLFIVQGESIRSIEQTLSVPNSVVVNTRGGGRTILLFLVILSTGLLSAFSGFDRLTSVAIFILFVIGIFAGLLHRKIAGVMLALGREFSVGLAAAVEGFVRLSLVIALADIGEWIFVAIPASSIVSLTVIAAIQRKFAIRTLEKIKVTWTLDWLLALGFLFMSVVANGSLAWISLLWGSGDKQQLSNLAVTIGIDRAVILMLLLVLQGLIFRQMLLVNGGRTFWSNTLLLIVLIFFASVSVSFLTAALRGNLDPISVEFFTLHIGNSLFGLLVIRSLRFAKRADSKAFVTTWLSTSLIFIVVSAVSISTLGPELSFGLAQLISALAGLILATRVLKGTEA